jgi:hypothetical protein
VTLSIIVTSVIMLSVVMLSVVMVSLVAPSQAWLLQKKLFQAPIVWCRLMRVSGDHRSGPDVIKLFTSVIYKMFEIS